MKKILLILLLILTSITGFSQTRPDWLNLRSVPAVDVRLFGAKVDGSTDDTAAVQAAMDSGNPWIFFPSGKCLISGVTVPNTVKRISGVTSALGTTISEKQSVLVATEGSTALGIGGVCRVEDIMFVGALWPAEPTGTGVRTYGAYTEIDRCVFWWMDFGVNADNSTQAFITNSKFISCEKAFICTSGATNTFIDLCSFYSCDSAVYCDNIGSAPTEAIRISNSELMECGSLAKGLPALFFKDLDYLFLGNCIVDQGGYQSLLVNNCTRTAIDNSFFSSPVATDPNVKCVVFQGNCSSTTISNTTFAFNKGTAVNVFGVAGSYPSNMKFSSCCFYNNNRSGVGASDIIFQDVGTEVSMTSCAMESSAASFSVAVIASFTPSEISLYDCSLSAGFYSNGNDAKIKGRDNSGFITRNTGYATIPGGVASVTVPLTLSHHANKGIFAQVTPVTITHTPISAFPTPTEVYFTIDPVVTSATSFYWAAELLP